MTQRAVCFMMRMKTSQTSIVGSNDNEIDGSFMNNSTVICLRQSKYMKTSIVFIFQYYPSQSPVVLFIHFVTLSIQVRISTWPVEIAHKTGLWQRKATLCDQPNNLSCSLQYVLSAAARSATSKLNWSAHKKTISEPQLLTTRYLIKLN